MRSKDIANEIIEELKSGKLCIGNITNEVLDGFILTCVERGFEAGLNTEVLEDCPSNIEAKFCACYAICVNCKDRKL